MLLVLLPLTLAAPTELYRQIAVETALAQVRAADPTWPEDQRDCAGLVRYSYRAAYKALEPGRLEAGLWRDRQGQPRAFADAESLLMYSFTPLGRDQAAQAALLPGDLLAFRQEGADAPRFHLMIFARTPRLGGAVVYHPGEPGQPVRVGALRALAEGAPPEWRPVPENPAFLGFFRFREWVR